MSTIRVELPAHLRTLGRIAGREAALDSLDELLPDAVAEGREPMILLGAVAGGSLRAAVNRILPAGMLHR
jgi:hypothetical protein